MNLRSLFAFSSVAFAAVASAQVSGVQLLGIQTISTGYQYGPSVVGGLSGIDYDAASGTYYIQSDARTSGDGGTPGRYYTATISSLTSGTFGANSVQLTGISTIKQPDGTAFPYLDIDPEAIRYHGGKLYVSSEGDANAGQNPFVRSYNLDGTQASAFTLPSRYNAVGGSTTQGIRQNLAFESLTFSPNGNSLYTATENALWQDGPAATTTNGSNSRILRFDATTGLPTAEFVYQTDAIAVTPTGASPFGVNGLVELLAADDHRLLALERSFSTGTGNGNSVKLYEIDLSGATDVSSIDSVADMSGINPVGKRLVYDFNVGTGLSPAQLDNLEGMTWGPTLADGSRSLVVVSDNNFNSAVGTQFIALKVQAVPEPSTMVALSLGAAAFLRRRRR